jgi:integrase
VKVLQGIERVNGQEHVFLYEGRPVSNAYGKAAWRKACKRAGLEGLRFHDLRHTWASWLIQAGVRYRRMPSSHWVAGQAPRWSSDTHTCRPNT